MSLHTWHHQGPHKPSSCASFTLNPHWGRAATGKKKVCIYAHRITLAVSNSLRCCRLWPARLLRQGCSPGKNTGAYWPILAAIPFQSIIFPAALAAKPPEYLVLPEPQAAASPLALTGANPSPPGQPQEQTPGNNPYPEVEIKPQLKPRGGVTKEEDPKPFHQVYKLQIKSTR